MYLSESNQSAHFTSARIIFMLDGSLSLLGSLLSILLVRLLADPIPGFTGIVLRYLAACLVGSVCGFVLLRTYRVVLQYMTAESSLKVLHAALVKEAVMILALLLPWVDLPSPTLCVVALLADFLLTMALLLSVRLIRRELNRDMRLVAERAGLKNVLVYGTSQEALLLAEEAQRDGRHNVSGFITQRKAEGGRVIGDRVVYYCASMADLDRLQWRLGGVDGILFPKGTRFQQEESRQDAADGAPVTEEDIPQGDAMSLGGHILKRSFDIGLSALLLVVFSPLIGLCALAVKLSDGGPVLYRQERIGRGAKPFEILKFRSMRVDAEKDAAPRLYAGEADPRLTPVGRFLRAHHLDELPQLWNVLRGDMSFIGYRPERQYFIRQIMERDPRYRYLYQIRPGVTSYATLYNGYTDTIEKMLTRLDLDLYYLRNHSVRFDAKVLALTFLGIVTGRKF